MQTPGKTSSGKYVAQFLKMTENRILIEVMQKQKVKRAITSLLANKEDASESYQQCKQ